jgi:hypothetical protein
MGDKWEINGILLGFNGDLMVIKNNQLSWGDNKPI